jgi:hypothetical protein
MANTTEKPHKEEEWQSVSKIVSSCFAILFTHSLFICWLIEERKLK